MDGMIISGIIEPKEISKYFLEEMEENDYSYILSPQLSSSTLGDVNEEIFHWKKRRQIYQIPYIEITISSNGIDNTLDRIFSLFQISKVQSITIGIPISVTRYNPNLAKKFTNFIRDITENTDIRFLSIDDFLKKINNEDVECNTIRSKKKIYERITNRYCERVEEAESEELDIEEEKLKKKKLKPHEIAGEPLFISDSCLYLFFCLSISYILIVIYDRYFLIDE
ncbi:hypothetical protein SNEBB_000004 [Seison nebaliae]|nr:hypothetical protein SNEBB_000004 [Seison nebaliae]